MYEQLSLFPKIIREILLKAETKRRAFYRLRIVELNGSFMVCKESGYGKVLLDSRVWSQDTLRDANNFFEKKIQQKVNPNRNSPRVYKRAG